MELKTEISGIYKDSNGALLNKNNSALSGYKKQKSLLSNIQTSAQEISEVKFEISNIKKDIIEIKKMLSMIKETI